MAMAAMQQEQLTGSEKLLKCFHILTDYPDLMDDYEAKLLKRRQLFANVAFLYGAGAFFYGWYLVYGFMKNPALRKASMTRLIALPVTAGLCVYFTSSSYEEMAELMAQKYLFALSDE